MSIGHAYGNGETQDTTTDLDVLIKLFDTNLRILKGIDIDSDRYMAGRIEELESTIRTLESLRNIASMSNRIDDEPERHPCKAGMSELWTPRQTAEYLGLSVTTLACWRSRGTHPDLRWKKYGHYVRYEPDAVRQWFDRHRQTRTSTRLEDCTRTKHIRRHS